MFTAAGKPGRHGCMCVKSTPAAVCFADAICECVQRFLNSLFRYSQSRSATSDYCVFSLLMAHCNSASSTLHDTLVTSGPRHTTCRHYISALLLTSSRSRPTASHRRFDCLTHALLNRWGASWMPITRV